MGLAEIRQELERVERTGGFRLRLGKGGRLTLMARGDWGGLIRHSMAHDMDGKAGSGIFYFRFYLGLYMFVEGVFQGKGRINVEMWKKLAINTGFECVLILCNPTPHGYCPEAGHGNVYRHAIGWEQLRSVLRL